MIDTHFASPPSGYIMGRANRTNDNGNGYPTMDIGLYSQIIYNFSIYLLY